MIAAAAYLLFVVALVCVVACIGAAMSYEDTHRPVDGYGAVISGFVAIVFAAVGGALVGTLL